MPIPSTTGAGAQVLQNTPHLFTPIITDPIITKRLVTQTGTSITVGVNDVYITSDNAGVVTVTLPSPSFKGRELRLRTINTGTVVSASANVVPLAGGAAGTAILAATAGKWALLVSDGTNWQIQASN